MEQVRIQSHKWYKLVRAVLLHHSQKKKSVLCLHVTVLITNQGECLSNKEQKYSCTSKYFFLNPNALFVMDRLHNVKGLITTGNARGANHTQRPLQGLLLIIELNRHCVGNILVVIMTPYDRVRKCNFYKKLPTKYTISKRIYWVKCNIFRRSAIRVLVISTTRRVPQFAHAYPLILQEEIHTFEDNCKFDVCVNVHLWYNSINNQLDATIAIYY